jgi:hypothetical protein
VKAIEDYLSWYLKNLRGRLVMIFDGKHTGLDPSAGLHSFSKYEELDGKPVKGLTTCGSYADSSSTKDVVEAAKKAAMRHFNGHGWDHLHFVYSRLINIISHDLVNQMTCRQIIELTPGVVWG